MWQKHVLDDCAIYIKYTLEPLLSELFTIEPLFSELLGHGVYIQLILQYDII